VTVDELFDGWEAAWSSRDPAAFEPICDPGDIHYEDPITPEPLESAAAIGAHAARLWAGFPDARMQRIGPRLVGPDGHAAAPAKMLGTHTAELYGLTPTNRFIIVQGVTVAQLRDGKLHRVRIFFDVWDAATQLGVLPRPGTLGEKALLMMRGFGLKREK
jgi:hypothetical protein